VRENPKPNAKPPGTPVRRRAHVNGTGTSEARGPADWDHMNSRGEVIGTAILLCSDAHCAVHAGGGRRGGR
jgi:hypothetical protein